MVEDSNVVDKKLIDLLIDQENFLYSRVRSRLTDASIGGTPFEIKVAMVYLKVHDRIAEESGEQE